MKKVLRALVINIFSLWVTSLLVEGFSYKGGIFTLVAAAFVFGVLNLLLKPIVRFFLLPINLLTLGLFGWLVNVLMLYILTLFVPQIEISSFTFPGFEYHGFVVPSFWVSQFWCTVLASLGISVVSGFFHWLCR